MKEHEKVIIEQELRKIEQRDGVITPSAVVEAAEPETSPLHSHFQWNNDKAAHEYRLWQARQLIAVVIFERVGDEPQRTFTSVVIEKTPNGKATEPVRAYVDTKTVLDDPALRQQVLQQAIIEARRWATKYHHLSELAELAGIIETFCDRFDRGEVQAAA